MKIYKKSNTQYSGQQVRPTIHHVFGRLKLIKTFWKIYLSNIWMMSNFFNWIHPIPISEELIKNLSVRTTVENFEFSELDPQLSKLF